VRQYFRGLSGADWKEFNEPPNLISSKFRRAGGDYFAALRILVNEVALRSEIINHSWGEGAKGIFVSASTSKEVAQGFSKEPPDPSGITVEIITVREPLPGKGPGEHEWLFFWAIGEQGEHVQVVW
jgi:hypothetical protein